ncbi:MAG: class II aldolase/adducin family protein [Candidatus Neomarinimicrobiota bacterium]
MAEIYSGPKFQTIFKARQRVTDERLPELSAWCRRFSEYGLAPAAGQAHAGNMSIRSGQGFIITAAGADLGNMQADDYGQVLEMDVERRRVIAIGLKEPSSETIMHSSIYERRPEINAVFHGHDPLVLQYGSDLNLPISAREQPYGTLELVGEVQKVLGRHYYIVLRGHGFLALGETMDRAGNEALRYHDAALALFRSAAQ